MPYIDPNQKKRLPLPLGVTTGPSGTYTPGAPPLVSRSAANPRVPTRVDLPPLPAFLGPAPPSTGRYTQSNVGRNRQPTLAPPAGASGISVIPAVQARPMATPAVPLAGSIQADMTAEAALGQSNLQPPPGSVPAPLVAPLQGQLAADALNSTAPGTAVISGKFAGQTAPQTRSYGPAGIADAASRANIVPGLFSGVSRETEQALGEARQAASKRGDFEAVERSYLTTPEQRTQYDTTQAEGRILKRIPGLPAKELSGAMTGYAGLQAAKTKALPTLDQYRAAAVPGLLSGETPTEAQRVLFGQKPPPLAQAPRVYNRQQFQEGERIPDMPYTLDAQGNAVPVKFPGQGAAQAQVPPEHIAMLQANSTPEMIAHFEEIYGPGSAAQYIKK